MWSPVTFTAVVTFPLALAQAPSYIPPELSSILQYQSSRFSECNSFIRTCYPGISSCASWICQECTGLGQSALASCCATDAAPSSCLATALRLPASASAGMTTPTTALATPTITAAPSGGPAACNAVDESISVCNSLTPGFTNSVFELQAPCLCYDASLSFAPTLYDQPLQTCLSYLASDSPGYYASLTSAGLTATAPCSSIGDIVHRLLTTGSYATSTSVSPTPTTSTGGARKILSGGSKVAAILAAVQEALLVI